MTVCIFIGALCIGPISFFEKTSLKKEEEIICEYIPDPLEPDGTGQQSPNQYRPKQLEEKPQSRTGYKNPEKEKTNSFPSGAQSSQRHVYNLTNWNDTPTATSFIWPLKNYESFFITSGYKTYKRPSHEGIDISGPEIKGAAVLAVTSGKVFFAGYSSSSYGNMVIIHHEEHMGDLKSDFYTVYAHLLSINVKKGQDILSGNILGKVGGSSIKGCKEHPPHLHYEVRIPQKEIALITEQRKFAIERLLREEHISGFFNEEKTIFTLEEIAPFFVMSKFNLKSRDDFYLLLEYILLTINPLRRDIAYTPFATNIAHIPEVEPPVQEIEPSLRMGASR